jgi:ComF family protein
MLYNWRDATRTLRRALDAALPQRCALCACASDVDGLCRACALALAAAAPACPRCALPSPAGAVCGRCVSHPPAFDAALAAGAYAFPLDRLVLRLKFGVELSLAAALGARLATVAAASGATARVDVLCAVPLAPARQRRRGCNQAREIAKAVARGTGLPLVRGLERRRHDAAQAGLPWRERVRNVRGAFAATRALDGLRIALVDDVMTTGSTASAAAAALRRAGAARVEAWVVARTSAA